VTRSLKNLNINWNKLPAGVLIGTMFFGFSGCREKIQREEIQRAYVNVQDQHTSYFVLYD